MGLADGCGGVRGVEGVAEHRAPTVLDSLGWGCYGKGMSVKAEVEERRWPTVGLRLEAAARHAANVIHERSDAIATGEASDETKGFPITNDHNLRAFRELAGTPEKLGALFASAPSLKGIFKEAEAAEVAASIDWDVLRRDLSSEAFARAQELHRENPTWRAFQLISKVRDESLHEAWLMVNQDEKME